MSTASAAEHLPHQGVPDSFWRSLVHLNYFRLYLACALALAGLGADQSLYRLVHPELFFLTCAIYFLTAWLFKRVLAGPRIDFDRHLIRQGIVDILCLVTLMHLSGGNASGLGLLLIVTTAALGMLRETRMVLFWVSVAVVALLAEQIAISLGGEMHAAGFARAGLLALTLFATGLLSHALAMGARTASRLALDKAQQAESLERVNARVVQELPYAVLVLNGEGEVLVGNGKAESLLGVQFFPHCPLRQCSPALDALWWQWLRGGEVNAQPQVLGPDRHRVRPRFIEFDSERQEGAMVVLEDLTLVEDEAQKMKLASLGMLTANLAHEIRNPLSAIRHAAGLLKEDTGSEVTRRLTRIIEDNTQRLNTLVEDVLAMSRRDRATPEPIDLPGYVESFLQQFEAREAVPAGRIVLEVVGEPLTWMDSGHLEQILWNLLRNAWRYCSKLPASVRVKVFASEQRAVIDISNDGPGVPVDIQQRLFEPFYTTEKKGTGLGLFIARELAEANHASLRYVDNPEGAQFRLTCPSLPHQDSA
jgi:two-component system sensor histidine kinase PilS (NtrC family)